MHVWGRLSHSLWECLCYFDFILLADYALGISFCKALENCTWCSSLSGKSIKVLSKGSATTAAFVGWHCLLIISRICGPGGCTPAQPPPCQFRLCWWELLLFSRQGQPLVQLPRRISNERDPEILADKLRLIKDIHEAAYKSWQTAQSKLEKKQKGCITFNWHRMRTYLFR